MSLKISEEYQVICAENDFLICQNYLAKDTSFTIEKDKFNCIEKKNVTIIIIYVCIYSPKLYKITF